MKTISDKLRELARKPNTSDWNFADWEACGKAEVWREHRWRENLDDLNPEEWATFCLFVAEALESESS